MAADVTRYNTISQGEDKRDIIFTKIKHTPQNYLLVRKPQHLNKDQ